MKQDQERDKNLRKTIEELQSFDSDLNLWNRIHDRLDYEEKVTKLIPFLPEFDSRTNLWDAIENDLNQDIVRKRKKVISIASYSTAGAIAASVALVISIEFSTPEPVLNPDPKTVTISYSEEVVHNDHEIIKKNKNEAVPVDNVETAAISFINTNCEINAHVCETPEFKELKSQLIELESQMGMLEEALKYGEDPELIKTKIKIENLKSRITKELIQKLNS
jgi:lipoate-protein ligase A